jgi:hypothetical protein
MFGISVLVVVTLQKVVELPISDQIYTALFEF